MPPHSSNILKPENIETTHFPDVNLSDEASVIDSKKEKPKIIIIHGRKYDVTNFNHPGKLKISFI